MIGANYQNDNSREQQQSRDVKVSNSALPGGTFDAINTSNNQAVVTKAVFGSLDYDLLPTLTAQVSGRYTDQRRAFNGCASDIGDGKYAAVWNATFGTSVQPGGCVTLYSLLSATPSHPPFSPAGLYHDNLNQNNFSWRASLNWKPSTHFLLYGNVTKGYKAGGYPTLPAGFVDQLKPATQESLLAYEVGFKADALEHKLQLTGAAFYYDYKDKQIIGSLLVPPFGNLSALVNLPKSRVKGAELEVTIHPTHGLRVSGGITYVDSLVQSNPANAFDPYGNPASFVGEQFPNTPQWQAVVDAEEKFAITNQVNAFVGGGIRAFSNHAGS